LAAAKRSSLTGRRRRRGLAAASAGSVPSQKGAKAHPGKAGIAGWSRQRASEATLHARRAADKATVGKHGARGLRSRSSPETRGARIERALGASALGDRPKGCGSLPKLEVRRQAKLHPMVRRAVVRAGRKPRMSDHRRVGAGQKVAGSKGFVAGGDARSGVEQRTECSCRASVAEVGETHLSRGEARGNPVTEQSVTRPAARWLEATHQPLTRRDRARGE
jgi:hypothetical protein